MNPTRPRANAVTSGPRAAQAPSGRTQAAAIGHGAPAASATGVRANTIANALHGAQASSAMDLRAQSCFAGSNGSANFASALRSKLAVR